MNRFLIVFLGASIITMLSFSGCGSSGDTYGKQEGQSSPTTSTEKPAEQTTKGLPNKNDTVNVDVQSSPKPAYEPKAAEKAPAGKYSVQVGAYKMSDNADRIASLARERFGRNVYTVPDKVNDLYKVMVGDFGVKDDARRFRDEMVQKYPSDYKDAWVAELPQK